VNVLHASQQISNLQAQLIITTDKVYKNFGKTSGYVESEELGGQDPYSASKASAEMIVNSYIKTYGVEAIGVRCSNNYGPRQNSEKLIPAFIRKLTRGEKVPVYGSGLNVREWIHVSDSVSGIIKVMLEGKVGEYYNISSGDFNSNLEDIHYKLLVRYSTEDKLKNVLEIYLPPFTTAYVIKFEYPVKKKLLFISVAENKASVPFPPNVLSKIESPFTFTF
jgi:dTDP-D-glucose 4,6-dehydratase